MPNEPTKRKRRPTVQIDFDGSILTVPVKYRTIRAQAELREEIKRGECPHPAVAITVRCQGCGRLHIYIANTWPEGAILGECRIRQNEIV